MSWTTRTLLRACLPLATLAAAACSDGPTQSTAPAKVVAPASDRVAAAVRWNEYAVELVVKRPPTGNGQAAVSRNLTYLSLAQYRAAMAARAEHGPGRPSVAAAVGGASVAVLRAFYPNDVTDIEARLSAELALPAWPGTKKHDIEAGEALGRQIGAAVVARAAQDRYLTVAAGSPSVGAGKWTSAAGVGIVRSLHGTQPFFLTSPNQIRPPAPPAFGSPEYLAALAEVRAISDNRTDGQIASAKQWNTSSGPFTAGSLNLIADGLIREHRSSEVEAARILAFGNAAAFDAQIACWDAKFAYWFIRPSQADPGITLPIALPNHPSYPSGHSCMSAALLGVVADAFPQDAKRLEAMVEEAGMSRVYGGIHYRFDIEAGRDIGRAAAAAALEGGLE